MPILNVANGQYPINRSQGAGVSVTSFGQWLANDVGHKVQEKTVGE